MAKDTTLQVRLKGEQKEYIRSAGDIINLGLSAFCLKTLLDEAKKIHDKTRVA